MNRMNAGHRPAGDAGQASALQRRNDRAGFVDKRAGTAKLLAQQQRADASIRVAQSQEIAALADPPPMQDAENERGRNDTGMPAVLKAGIEALSGMDMSAVRVHRHSDKPGQLNAHAYAQGAEIHLAPGQDKHLPHEAWHIVQQRQGRVPATRQMAGRMVNDDAGLEREADRMGALALQHAALAEPGPKVGMSSALTNNANSPADAAAGSAIVQRKIMATNFADLMTEQEALQHDARTNPDKYAGRLVTVGFEHEFGAFFDETLHGVSHLQIGESSNRLPYKNLPFYLETDAGNEIELVDPPFLIETIEPGRPVPHPVDLDIASQIVESTLYEAILNFPTLYELVRFFRTRTGIDFHVPPVKVQAKNLSANTVGNYHAESAPLSSVDLLDQRLGPSQKYSGGKISTQTNFATTAFEYSKIQTLNQKKLDSDHPAVIHAEKYADVVKKRAKTDAASEKLEIFYDELFRQLVAQAVLPLMSYIREAQRAEYSGQAKIRDRSPEEKSVFNSAGKLTSIVKDVNLVWVKDSLMSIGFGILDESEWKKVAQDIASAYADLESLPGDDPDSAQVKSAILSVLREIRSQIPWILARNEIYMPAVAPGFMEHDPRLLGVRQDTYIKHSNAHMPGIWKERLHVIEIRKGLEPVTRLVNGDASKDQMVADKRQGGAGNYNMRMRGYFKAEEGFRNPLTGKSSWKLPSYYSERLKMDFDPSIGMYFDKEAQAFYDQAVGAYHYPAIYARPAYCQVGSRKFFLDPQQKMYRIEADLYFDPQTGRYYRPSTQSFAPAEPFKFTLHPATPEQKAYYKQGEQKYYFDSNLKMYKFGEDRYFDQHRGAWYTPSTQNFTFARIESFKNPSQNIEINPRQLPRAGTYRLEDIFHDFRSFSSKNRHTRAILASIADVDIPRDTPQKDMISLAFRLRFGNRITLKDVYQGLLLIPNHEIRAILSSVYNVDIPADTNVDEIVPVAFREKFGREFTLAQVYFGIDEIVRNPQTAGAQMLALCVDVPIPYDTPPEQMVMYAYANRATTTKAQTK